MKLRATVFAALLALLGTAITAEALILDAPHNIESGIYCYHCHSKDPGTGEDYWYLTNLPTNADLNRNNWVCLRCHADPSDPRHTIDSSIYPADRLLAGPVKRLHSSSSFGTTGTKGTWSTKCTDCHDPHFQLQKDHGLVDGDSVYVAKGTFLDALINTYDPYDVLDPVGNPTGLGGPFGTTTWKIRVDIANPGYDLPLTQWVNKGHDPIDIGTGTVPFQSRAVDGSRGLILVVDPDSPVASRTFEIVSVTDAGGGQYYMTVNGNAVRDEGGQLLITNAAVFGVLYGGSIKTVVPTPNGGQRTVKYYDPKQKIAVGATIDPVVSATPVGLCQVCHTATNEFSADATADANPDHHLSDGTICSDCHDVLTGAKPEVTHTNGATPFIVPDAGCPNCHVGYDTAPDTAHISSVDGTRCLTCHTSQAPNMNATTVGRTTAVYGSGNTNVIHGISVTCLDCHAGHDVGHPALAFDVTHNTRIAPQALCVTACHGTLTTGSTGNEIVTNADTPGGHSNNCGLCHLTVTAPVELVAKAIPAVGGTGSDCSVCHSSPSPYFPGGHNHDHTLKMSNVAPCNGCHNAVDTAAPDAKIAPYAGVGEVHGTLGCLTCHSGTDGSPKVGSSARSGWGTTWATTASGDCTTCHGAYFNSHTHTHDVSFNSTLDKTKGGTKCFTCHDDANKGKGTLALGTWSDILVEHQTVAQTPVVPGCPTCHSYTNADAQNTPTTTAVSSQIATGTSVHCISCHVAKNTLSHGSHTSTEFGWSPATRASCGITGTSRGAGACHDDVTNTDVVLNVHGHISTYLDDGNPCNLCHVDVLTNNYARKAGVGGDGDATLALNRQALCTDCHTLAIPAIHHVNNSPNRTYTASTDCAVKCHNATLGDAGDHTNLVANALAITNVQKACLDCHPGTPGGVDNVPLAAGDDKIHDTCTTCHVINGTTKMVDLITPPSARGLVSNTMNNADGNTLTNNGGGTCIQCHTGYFDSHLHHTPATGLNKLVYNYHAGQSSPYADPIDGAPTYVDVSWGAAAGCGSTGVSAGCHQDYEAVKGLGGDALPGEALNTWAGVQFEHDRTTANVPPGNTLKDGAGSCTNCHYNSRASGINEDKFGIGASTSSVVAFLPKTATNCVDCHFDKKAPKVHGLTYVDHFQVNLTPQATLHWIPIIASPECSLSCHYYVIGGTDDGTDTNDIIIGIHKNACGACHESQPDLKTVPNMAQFARTLNEGVHCNECHSNTLLLTTAFHGVLANDGEMATRHDKLADSANVGTITDCLACHAEMYDANVNLMANKKLARHMINFVDIATTPEECLVCHNAPDLPLGGNSATGQILAGKGVAGVAQTCEACHDAAGTYRLHGLTDAAAAGIHLNLTADATCTTGCHGTLANQTLMLNKHTLGCTQCHAAADFNATWKAKTVIDEGRAATSNGVTTGGNQAKTCASCHDAAAGSYLMHGLSNAAAQGVHDKFEGSTVTDGSANDCGACHLGANTALDATARLGFHPTCETCHNAGGTALTVINLGRSGSGNTVVNCQSCHITPGGSGIDGSYSLHVVSGAAAENLHNNIDTLTSGYAGADNCLGCHDMNSLAKIVQGHTSLTKNPAHTGKTCVTSCHGYSVSQAGGAADLAIKAGWSGAGIPALQKCNSCHAAKGAAGVSGSYSLHGLDDTTGLNGVANEHEYIGDASGGANVACTTVCHTTGTAVARVQLHTGGTTTCLTCHTSTAPAVVNAIAAGWNDTPATANCDTCHTSYFDSHSHHDLPANTYKVRDNDLATDQTVNCVYCHTATATPFIGSGEAHQPSGCGTCHLKTVAKSGILIGAAVGNTTGAECITCHNQGPGGAYFSSHLHRDLNTGTYAHTTAFNVTTDLAQPAAPSACYNCHDDEGLDLNRGTTALNSWTKILTEHIKIAGVAQNPCIVCHTSTKTTVDTVAFPAATTVQDVIAAGGTVRCLSCHYDKRSSGGVSHGGHDASQFDWDATSIANCGTSGCHNYVAAGNPAVVDGVHNGTWAGVYGNVCQNCHIGQGGGDNTLYTITNDPHGRAPNLYTQDSTSTLQHQSTTCTDCHSGVAGGFSGHLHNHGSTIEKNTSATPVTVNCAGCHTTGATAPYIAAGTPGTHTACSNCHDATTGVRISKAANANQYGSATIPAECNECHTGYFGSHTHHDGASNQVKYDVAIDRSQGADLPEKACAECHNDRTGDNTAFGTLAAPVWEGIRLEHDVQGDGGLGCNTCHDAATLPEKTGLADTPLDSVVATRIATNANTICTQCHTQKLQPAASSLHGGHTATQFAWQTTSKTSCGVSGKGSGCHDDSGASAVIGVIHNSTRAAAMPGGSKCLLCHSVATGGENVYRAYDPGTMVGNPSLGENVGEPNHDIPCETCHNQTAGAIHHTGAAATGGNCISCHMPKVGTQGNPIATRSTIMMPKELACNFCHLWWPNNKTYGATNPDIKGYDTTTVSGKVMIYKLIFNPTVNLRQMATATAVTSHAISTNATTPINDYGACFACHGATGNGSNGTTGTTNYALGDEVGKADMIVPFHGLGNPTTATEVDTIAGEQSTFLRHVNNFFAGPIQNTEGTGLVMKNEYWNPGYGAFNWMAPELSMNPSGGTKPYANSTKAYKSIHKSEFNNRYGASGTKQNPTLSFSTPSATIQWNDWGADKTTGNSRTFNVGILGSKTKTTLVPLVPLAIPTNVLAQ